MEARIPRSYKFTGPNNGYHHLRKRSKLFQPSGSISCTVLLMVTRSAVPRFLHSLQHRPQILKPRIVTYSRVGNSRPINSSRPFRAPRTKSIKMTEATINPLSGLWRPTHLKALYYGPGSVAKHLLQSLPEKNSKAFIVTGTSLATNIGSTFTHG